MRNPFHPWLSMFAIHKLEWISDAAAHASLADSLPSVQAKQLRSSLRGPSMEEVANRAYQFAKSHVNYSNNNFWPWIGVNDGEYFRWSSVAAFMR